METLKERMDALTRKTTIGFAQLIVGLGVLLFAPAWTLDFWQAWVYLFVFAASAAVVTVYLWKRDPKLLERRVRAGPGAEKEAAQRVIQLMASVAFVGVLVVPAIDHRLAWSRVPLYVVIAGNVSVATGFVIVFLVFRENTFTAATIEVAADQTVIATGSYAVVRHPMYAGALIMLFGTPLALGSSWGLLMFIPITLVIVWRLLDEEKFLSKNLPGYSNYTKNVRYRLLPFVW